ncbi:PEP-CTERM sorting domain-containing protein [Urbifossiella limnaea]|uniref:PEP-CTERM sorting domain-containing protein n=1 Tax=Urbifossiella limnaea TaxID=2528023 RepID=A0A517XPJ6_9BACT|nr:PEP-CTERM sorting domain-containing protein [Urbifossiella limnaea]QDU19414.1 hypothetical protein ETAA1_13380 [Urbifossiella limnaea]
MRRRFGWMVVLSAATVTGLPGVGRAGWLSLTAGVAGSVEPLTTADLWFNFPGGTPTVVVTQAKGTGTVQANAGGAVTHFGGLGVPVLLTLADGTAYLAAGELPPGVTARTPAGVPAGSASSATPVTGAEVPSNAVLLGVTAGDDGLTFALTDGTGAALGSGTLAVPAGGWWVAGLGADAKPNSGPIDPPGDPDPVPTEPAEPTDPGTVPGVPEPATLLLGLIGAGGVVVRRRWFRPAARAARRA